LNKDKDYYKILEITHSADKKEIKKAYRQLARKFHPDINPGNKLCEVKFKEVGEAFSILNDDKKRLQYDILKGFINTKTADNEQTKSQASKAYSGQKQDSKNREQKVTKKKQYKQFDVNFNDILKGFTEKFSKFEEKSSQQNKSTKEPQKPTAKKGEDIQTDVNITVTEAHNGTVRKVNILRIDMCPKCKGKRIINYISCNNCNGKGEVSIHKQLNVKIPPKVKEGSKIRITGEGNKGTNGGENGDLFLLVHILKSSNFTFDGINVHCEVPITPTEAALGAEIQIPSIDGFINMKIPPETRSGQKFKLAGEGLPDVNTGRRGDQIASVRIELPSNLNEKEKELYRELAKLRKFNPREHMIFEK